MRETLVTDELYLGLRGIVRVLDGLPVVGGERDLDGRVGMKNGCDKTEQKPSGAKMTHGRQSILAEWLNKNAVVYGGLGQAFADCSGTLC